jgi:dihydrofolate reductase
MNSMPKYVVSSTLTDPSWDNSHVVSGDLAGEIYRLKDEAGELLVAGSAQLVHGLMAEDLIDELRLMVYPTVLGTGKRLFAEGTPPRAMRLVEAGKAAETLLLTYEVTAS